MSEVAATATTCFHCGQACSDRSISDQQRFFCCAGCLSVYQLLRDARLDGYYTDRSKPGQRPAPEISTRFAYLDEASVQSRLLDYQDDQIARVTLKIQQMHCASCIYLLERLYQLNPGIERSAVDFPHQTLQITFQRTRLGLRQIVELLAHLGYEPDIKLAHLDRSISSHPNRRLYAQLGIAGFAFANIMLFSLPEYFSGGLKEGSLSTTFRLACLLLVLPIVFYSAADYFRSAYVGLKTRTVNLNVPIALGMAMLFLRSAYDIVLGAGPGYLDSFSGLVFFLLLGKLFQQKTFERLSFDRDYRSYFPISVIRIRGQEHSAVPITDLAPGDQILVRNQELVPADAILLGGKAQLDYSFVTGEADPHDIPIKQKVYAGGKQCGGAIELEVIRPVAQSYLVSLWSGWSGAKPNRSASLSLANRVGGWFTYGVLVISAATLVIWLLIDPARAFLVSSSVLIVACPCALALSSPFVLGTASRLWGKHGLFVRDVSVIENMFDLDSVVFDKTGTLTQTHDLEVAFSGEPLSPVEQRLVVSLVRHSAHPASRAIALKFGELLSSPVQNFLERAGEGIQGTVEGHVVRIGRAEWAVGAAEIPGALTSTNGTSIHLAIDAKPRGSFLITNLIREGLKGTLSELQKGYELTVLSGDSARDEKRIGKLFDRPVPLLFDRAPHEKCDEIVRMTASRHKVLMLGDGLNDAGALRAATVGIAVTDDTSAFAPACDAIMNGSALSRLPRFLSMARRCHALIYVSFGLSFVYNVIGLSIAVSGHLSPLIAAILMPASSISVVLFAVLSTRGLARREGLS